MVARIVAGRKKIEYRAMKKYWRDRFAKIGRPFELRLINGMSKTAPEVTVLITRVRKNLKRKAYELHIGKVLSTKYWDRRREQPRAR